MKNISIVIEVKPEFVRYFRKISNKRRLTKICKAMSRGYDFAGFYHPHQTEKKGGEFSPHVHLLVWVPEKKFERYVNGLNEDLELKDRSGYFRLSPQEQWVLDFDDKYYEYCVGAMRINPPLIL